MTNITLSINNEVYEKMKKFSEIKWSSFVRKMISKRIEELERIKSGTYADEKLLSENWLSEEDNLAWKDL
jgi:predicted CopG family antitoxin